MNRTGGSHGTIQQRKPLALARRQLAHPLAHEPQQQSLQQPQQQPRP
jgi:hypothetical protein